jgi:adenylate cyclase
MTDFADLQRRVTSALAAKWNGRNGTVVPEDSAVPLIGGYVNLDATILYADLADSTETVLFSTDLAARLFKAYLTCCTLIIREHGGEIRSFDGDRVMGVFIGDHKNTSAVKSALKINHAFEYLIRPEFEEKYEACRNGGVALSQCVGVDTSTVYAVRSGIRNNNDLVWVGRAANIAANLSAMREVGYVSYITSDVFDRMNETVKYGGEPKELMWEQRNWNQGAQYEVPIVYRSNWWWNVDC